MNVKCIPSEVYMLEQYLKESNTHFDFLENVSINILVVWALNAKFNFS